MPRPKCSHVPRGLLKTINLSIQLISFDAMGVIENKKSQNRFLWINCLTRYRFSSSRHPEALPMTVYPLRSPQTPNSSSSHQFASNAIYAVVGQSALAKRFEFESRGGTAPHGTTTEPVVAIPPCLRRTALPTTAFHNRLLIEGSRRLS